jgi:hypothetical protein
MKQQRDELAVIKEEQEEKRLDRVKQEEEIVA